MAQDPRSPNIVRNLVYLGMAYTILPIDFLPGPLDDFAIISFLITLIRRFIPETVKETYSDTPKAS